MKIRLSELRAIIRHILAERVTKIEDEGHEPSSEMYQMNHQGDGDRYDQMGHLMDSEDESVEIDTMRLPKGPTTRSRR